MKKFLSFLLVFTIIFTAFIFPVSGAMSENSDNISIVVPSDRADNELFAAKTMRKYIEKITGKPAFIINDSMYPTGKAVYIRQTDDSNLPQGSYTLKEDKGNLIIEGAGIRGEIYGVYGFLENYCGCRWYTKDIKIVPETGSFIIPENLDYTYKPYFEYADTDWTGANDFEFALSHGLSGKAGMFEKEHGGSTKYISGFCHTFTTQFCKAEEYFITHPEYFAYREQTGARCSDQLCLTNPDVLKIVTDEVLEVCRQYHDPDADVQIISLTQHDNFNYCQCEKCKALDEKNGSHAGTMITFVNEVAKAVKAAGYDNIAIDTFAYQYTRKPPKEVVPEDNVIVRLCSIECCFAHTLDDERCELNREFMQDLNDWGKICSRIYIWDYTNNFEYSDLPFPDFAVLQRNMQIFYENNAKGVFEEGSWLVPECDTEFAALRTYLIAKLLQNPYIDYEKEKQDFLKVYYGEAWDEMNEYIDFTCARAAESDVHMDIWSEARDTLASLTDEDIVKIDYIFEKAKEDTAGGEFYDRVRRSELSWRTWKFYMKKGEFSEENPGYRLVLTKYNFFKDIDAFGITKNGIHDRKYPKRLATKLFAPICSRGYDDNIIIVLLDPYAELIVHVIRFFTYIFRS